MSDLNDDVAAADRDLASAVTAVSKESAWIRRAPKARREKSRPMAAAILGVLVAYDRGDGLSAGEIAQHIPGFDHAGSNDALIAAMRMQLSRMTARGDLFRCAVGRYRAVRLVRSR